ncbi:MAG: hypothetical protein FJZ56_07570 [Chlamydiae bacterium]|nr:hypothetical protein [Chlamydiota bacterium]
MSTSYFTAAYGLQYSSSFLLQPLIAADFLHNFENQKFIEEAERLEGLSRPVMSYALYEHKFPGVTQKIKKFIESELKLDIQNIDVFITPSDSDASAKGSLDKGHINISENLADEISKEFSNKHKFIIAHEVGHLFHRDGMDAKIAQIKNIALTNIAIYALAVTGCSFTDMHPLVIHAIGCTAAAAGSYFMHLKSSWHVELKADRFAAEKSKEIAKGGVEALQEAQKNVLQQKAKLFTQSAKTDSNPTLIEKISLALTDNEGNSYFESHPPISSRIAEIVPYC